MATGYKAVTIEADFKFKVSGFWSGHFPLLHPAIF